MTSPPLRPLGLSRSALLTTGLVLLVGAVLGVLVLRVAGSILPGIRRTTITEAAIVERLQSVAKLVTTEAMVRDVVTYEQTWLGSTKRALVIVTGKALVGIDLKVKPRITVRARDKHVTLEFPRAKLLGVDVISLKTYDENRGLWNPFHPADRDTIFALARTQLGASAKDLAVLEHAETSARMLLQGLFAAEGWKVEVVFAGGRR